ncbi:hypothetical protein ACFC0C_16450 [Streptomyces sp. NPDC056178]|uniref:hypothetical protein n=1 Tax=unclassified Streptomyces TaxID=2593676 RepID=UPI0035DC339A
MRKTSIPDTHSTDTLRLAEFLSLAAEFTRLNDRLHAETTAGKAAKLLDAVVETRRLTESTLDSIKAVHSKPMRFTATVRETGTSLRQVGYLATGAADHLIESLDILHKARPTVTGPEASQQYVQARIRAAQEVTAARELLAAAPSTCADVAESLATELRRQHQTAAIGPHVPLSPSQFTALQAVARGRVNVFQGAGKEWASSREKNRLTIATIRSLEAKELILLEPCPGLFATQRPHLTLAGRHVLLELAARPGPPRTATRLAAMPSRQPARSR